MTEARGSPGRDTALRVGMSMAFLIVSSACLFLNLGHYSFWGDEADTALFARSFAKNGRMLAVIDHNICAYDPSLVSENREVMFHAPLSIRLVSLFVGGDREDALSARIPIALCGLLASLWICARILRRDIRLDLAAFFMLGIASNASWFLYFRTSRYMGPTILLVLVISTLYLDWNGKRSQLLLLSALMVLLFETFFIAHAALSLCLLVDFLVFERKRKTLRAVDLVLFLLPQVAAVLWQVVRGLPPMNLETAAGAERSLLRDKIELLWWSFRDLNECEYVAITVMAACLVVFIRSRDPKLIRPLLAVVVFVVVTATLSYQAVGRTVQADVRYLAPVIVFGTAASAALLGRIFERSRALAITLAVLLASTNVLVQPLRPERWRSTIGSFIKEIAVPRATAMGKVVDWVREHVVSGSSVLVCPRVYGLPIQFHAPKPVYAWQLPDPPPKAFAAMPKVHVFGREPVDVIVAFGPGQREAQRIVELSAQSGVHYEVVERIPLHFDDMTRPELFWHSFTPIAGHDPDTFGVVILRRTLK